jgi:hypothetical protein
MVIYGMKMISLDDIIANTFIGRPNEICDYLKESIEKDIKYVDNLECKTVIDTSRQGNLPMINIVQPYKFIFSPMDYVENKIISSGMIDYINMIKKKIVVPKDIKEMDRMLLNYERRDEDFKTKYSTSDAIFVNSCFMFIFNEVFIDVYIVKPITLLKEVLLKKEYYKCKKCLNEKEFGNELPEMMYKVTDEIEYFCKECSKGMKGLKNIGE